MKNNQLAFSCYEISERYIAGRLKVHTYYCNFKWGMNLQNISWQSYQTNTSPFYFHEIIISAASVLLQNVTINKCYGQIVVTRNITKCTTFGKNVNRFWYIQQVLLSTFLLKLTWLALWMFDLPHHQSPTSMLISVIPVELIYHFLSII